MKKYLLTWYGITDFRASLGFENTDGPIASALVADTYSDVVVLCYTRAENDSPESIEAQKDFDNELKSIREACQEKDWKTTNSFISRFANTSVAHKHFVGWIKAKALKVGGNTKVWFKSEKLNELNDTEGIYACAMRALDWVEKQQGEKLATLYLSPGTPVMAFVWAFAALGHPELKKQLIASPVIGKPPETISLPVEWLERHGVKEDRALDTENGFDVTYHLFGEQRMPSLLGIRQFSSKQHVFINSKEYPASGMRAFFSEAGISELPVDPWDAHAVQKQITQHAQKLSKGSRIGINLTGGTKLMFAGALSAAREIGAIPFYFDSRNRRVTFFDSFRSEIIKPLDLVDSFLILNGDGLEISNSGKVEGFSPDRCILTKTLWKERSKLTNSYQKLKDYNDSFKPFRIEQSGFSFRLESNKVATVQGYGLDLVFENWPDLAKYLSGGWFEEYVYLLCKPYEDTGIIRDLRINIKLKINQETTWKSQSRGLEYNELDITFTDGYSLYIVECKAGNVTQEQVMKLQNLVRFYGGIEGRGIVACCFPPNNESVKKKIKDARLILWSGASLSDQIKTVMDGIAARAITMEVAS